MSEGAQRYFTQKVLKQLRTGDSKDKSLILSSGIYGIEGMTQVLGLLVQHPNVFKIIRYNFDNYSTDVEGMQIVKVVEATSDLHELTITGHQFSDTVAQALADALRINRSICHLNTSGSFSLSIEQKKRIFAGCAAGHQRGPWFMGSLVDASDWFECLR